MESYSIVRTELRCVYVVLQLIITDCDTNTILPASEGSGIALIIRSASLSMSSTMSLVSRQSCSYSIV